MTKSRSQILSEKADAERRRCRDWLLPFMQNNQPKVLTKDELSGAIRELDVSKRWFDMGWFMAIEDAGAPRLVRATTPTAAHQELACLLSMKMLRKGATATEAPVTPCAYWRSRAMSPIGGKAENICSI